MPTAISTEPDWPPSSPTAYDDEFTGTVLNSSLWSWVNQGGASANVSSSFLGLICPTPGGGDIWHLLAQTAPSTPWEFILCWLWNGSVEASYLYAGFVLYDPSSGKLITFHLDNASLQVAYWNSVNSFSAGQFATTWPRPGRHYMKVKDDGTNLIFSYSRDGVNFWTAATLARTAFLTPSKVCIGAGTNIGSGTMILSADFFRRTL